MQITGLIAVTELGVVKLFQSAFEQFLVSILSFNVNIAYWSIALSPCLLRVCLDEDS